MQAHPGHVFAGQLVRSQGNDRCFAMDPDIHCQLLPLQLQPLSIPPLSVLEQVMVVVVVVAAAAAAEVTIKKE